jgi:hypothetical protein
MATDVQADIDAKMAAADGVDPNAVVAPAVTGPTGPIYKVDPISKIPVSKHEGKVWESKIKAGKRVVNDLKEMWDEAERYYSNSQQNHRKDTGGDRPGNRGYSKDRRDTFSVTENMVYSTVNAVVPNIFTKNPDCEITVDKTLEKAGAMFEKLMDRLAAMESAPGFNLKPKVKKSIVRTEIMNEAWALTTKRNSRLIKHAKTSTSLAKNSSQQRMPRRLKRLKASLWLWKRSVIYSILLAPSSRQSARKT